MPDKTTLVGAAATDVFLDSTGNLLERLAGDQCGAWSSEFMEVTPDMRPAERKPHVATSRELAVTGIAIDLQNSFEALEVREL